MHYGGKSFSKNGKDTIRLIDPAVRIVLGQRRALSDIDVHQLALLYKCPQGKERIEYIYNIYKFVVRMKRCR